MALGAQWMIMSNRNNLRLRKIYRKPKNLGVAQKVDTAYSKDINPKVALPSTRLKRVQRIRQKQTIVYSAWIVVSILMAYKIMAAILF